MKIEFLDFGLFEVPSEDNKEKVYLLSSGHGKLVIRRRFYGGNNYITLHFIGTNEDLFISGDVELTFKVSIDNGELVLEEYVEDFSSGLIKLYSKEANERFLILDFQDDPVDIEITSSFKFHIRLLQETLISYLRGSIFKDRVISSTNKFEWHKSSSSYRLKTNHKEEEWTIERIDYDSSIKDASWRDYYRRPSEKGAYEQGLKLLSFRVSNSRNYGEVSFQPTEKKGLLHILPESLKKDKTEPKENPLIYAQSLANGVLIASSILDENKAKVSFKWSKRGSKLEGSPLLLLNHLQDENSLPIPFELLEDLDLEERATPRQSGDRKEKTTGGLMITGKWKNNSNEANIIIKGQIKCLELDHDNLDEITYKYEKGHGVKTIEQNDTKFYGPREIHGLALNSFLKRKEWKPDLDAQQDHIIVKAIDYPTGTSTTDLKPLGKTNSLKLSSSQYDIVTIFEEEEYLPNNHKAEKVSAVGQKNLLLKDEAKEIEIPATDIRFAVANMEASQIAEKSHLLYKELDEKLIENYKVYEKDKTIQKHTAKFKLKPNNPKTKTSSILGRINSAADSFEATDIVPIAPAETPHTFAFGKGEQINGFIENKLVEEAGNTPQPENDPTLDPIRGSFKAVDDLWHKLGDLSLTVKDKSRIVEIRQRILSNIEGKSDPAILIKQLLVTLRRMDSDIIKKELIENYLEESNFIEEWNKVRDGAINEHSEFFKVIQSTLMGWNNGANDFPEVQKLSKYKPIYHRIAIGVVRIALNAEVLNDIQNIDWNKLPFAETERINFKEFEDYWLGRNASNDEEFKKLKSILLWTLPPTKEVTQRFVEQLIKESIKESFGQDFQINFINKHFEQLSQEYQNVKLPEFDTLINQGVDANLESLQEIWEHSADKVIQDLRDTYKIPVFNKEVYERLLKEELDKLHQVARLIGKKELTRLQKEWRLASQAIIIELKALPEYKDLQRYSDKVLEEILQESEETRKRIAKLIGIAEDSLGELKDLKTLGENAGELLRSLKSEPPEYLLVSDRMHIEYSQDQQGKIDQLKEMFNRKFGLANIGDEFWDFQLSEDSSYIIKLTGSKSLEEIILDVQTAYLEDTGERDPLGLWDKNIDKDGALLRKLNTAKGADAHKFSKELVSKWVQKYLDPDLNRKTWRGVITFNSVIDLEGNKITRDLCGIRFIEAKYIAIQGGHITFDSSNKSFLNVYSTVYAANEAEERSEKDKGKTDSGIALTKFDVRVRNTEIRPDSRIELELNIDRLFGRDVSDTSYADDFDKSALDNYGKIKIIGSKSTENEEDKLEFAAIFPTPRNLPIKLACIDSIDLASIKASIYNERTVLDIDANINLKPLDINEFISFNIIDGSIIKLKDFRLVFPDLSKATDKAIGALRNMMFDFNSIGFELSKPRTIRMGQIDLTFKEIGFARFINDLVDYSNEAFKDLQKRFSTISGFGFEDDLFEEIGGFPYIVFDVDFGKFPNFMGQSIGNLKLNLLFGLFRKREGTSKIAFDPVLALGGLYAKDISFDFFRVLTLKIAELYLQNNVRSELPGYTDKNYTVLGAENIRLNMLGVDLIGKTSGEPDSGRGLDFLMLQDQESRRGLLFTLFNAPEDDAFVRVHWILLGKNIKVKQEILTYLLKDSGEPDSTKDAMKELVERNGTTVEKVNAGITTNEEWLFGIAFGLGELVTKGKLVFHDDHYYGISLRAEWLELLTGMEALTLAYIPGATSKEDKFYVEFPLSFLELFGPMRAGWLTAYWAFNTDFMFSLGFPFRQGAKYMWERSFSVAAAYEFQFGFYIEKRTQKSLRGNEITLGGGLAIAIGLGIALGNSRLWVRAGIGIFVIVEGFVTIEKGKKVFDAALVGFSLTGVIGILAYVEGGINIWIISARFRAELQASIAVRLDYHRDNQPLLLSYNNTLYAGYSATARIKIGFVKIRFTVRGKYPIQVKGQHLID